MSVRPTREQAWETLTRYTKSESLLRHALAVEASVGFYARLYGEDEEFAADSEDAWSRVLAFLARYS